MHGAQCQIRGPSNYHHDDDDNHHQCVSSGFHTHLPVATTTEGGADWIFPVILLVIILLIIIGLAFVVSKFMLNKNKPDAVRLTNIF